MKTDKEKIIKIIKEERKERWKDFWAVLIVLLIICGVLAVAYGLHEILSDCNEEVENARSKIIRDIIAAAKNKPCGEPVGFYSYQTDERATLYTAPCDAKLIFNTTNITWRAQ